VTIRARNAGALEALDAAMSVLGVRTTLRGRSIVLGDGPAARRGEDAERPCSGDAARFALLACSELSRIRVGGTITGRRQATLLIEHGPGATIAAAVIARPGIAVGRRAVTAGGSVIEAYVARIEPEAVVFEWRESDGTPHHTTRLPLGG
ncbi:MAG: hypothetical protein K8H88_34265, partial [Sandaracinaceae bacterium]|nr:hypothetical protein [Sandaracinaceae bacterium]